jgi:hypothetical protein
MMKSLAFYSALTVVVGVILVCAWSRNSTAVAAQPASAAKVAAAESKKAEPKVTPSVRVYNTGDSKVWPSLRLPLVYKIAVPEVPKGLTGPSPPIPPDRE